MPMSNYKLFYYPDPTSPNQCSYSPPCHPSLINNKFFSSVDSLTPMWTLMMIRQQRHQMQNILSIYSFRGTTSSRWGRPDHFSLVRCTMFVQRASKLRTLALESLIGWLHLAFPLPLCDFIYTSSLTRFIVLIGNSSPRLFGVLLYNTTYNKLGSPDEEW